MLSNGQGGSGLSPLARGTHEMVASHFTPNRFIPAGAGNTHRAIGKNLTCVVYPRWRGEHTNHILLFYNKFIHQEQSTDIFATN